MTRPGFHLIGAAKSGTTTLYGWLGRHPRIFLPRVKEPHYLQYLGERSVDRELVRVRTLEEYESLFEPAGSDRIAGDGSTMSLCFPEAAARARELTPDARIIAILRQPAERAWSHYHFRVSLRRETARSFEDALRLEKSRRAAKDPIGSHYLNVGRYAHHLEPWFKAFPQEQIHIRLFDDLRDRPQWLLQDILNSLGVDTDEPIDISEHRNVTSVPASRRLDDIAEYRGALRSLARRILPSAAKRSLYNLRDRNKTTPPPIPETWKRRLTPLFERDIRKLEDLIGRDLTTWRCTDFRRSA